MVLAYAERKNLLFTLWQVILNNCVCVNGKPPYHGGFCLMYSLLSMQNKKLQRFAPKGRPLQLNVLKGYFGTD